MSGTVSGPSVTEVQCLTVLRSFLLWLFPAGVEVIKGQQNRVPEPESANFIIMTPILRERIGTNEPSYADVQNPVGNPSGTRSVLQRTDHLVQLDFHGPNSGDNVEVFLAAFRDYEGCQFFYDSGIDAAPLYAEGPRQTPFLNGENQYEYRWTIDAHIQINPSIVFQQSFASSLSAGLIEADKLPI